MADQVVGRIVAEVGLKSTIDRDQAGILAGLNKVENASRTAGTNAGNAMADGFSKSTKNIENSVKSTEGSFKGLGTSVSNVFNTGLTGSVTKFVGTFTSASQQITKSIGVWGIAIAGGLSASLLKLGSDAAGTFMKFDDQMRKVQAVTESTGAQFDKLTDQAKYLGATTSFTAQEAAEGMTLLGQAGFDANQVIAAMPATLNLARGSMTGLATTADIMSNIMNGFRIAAEDTTRVSDVLAKAANATNTDVTGLGNAMKYVAPLAYQMGWSLEETAAAAGLLSNAGIKSSMAGTVLRNAISRLISPTDKAAQILQSYGISMDMVNPKTHSLAQIIELLSQRSVSAGDIMEVFGMRAGPGIAAMMNIGSGAIEKMNQTLLNSGGYAQEAANKMDAGWGGAVRRLGDAIEALQLSFGKAIATIATPFLNAISAIMVGISRLPQPILMAIAAIGGIAAVALGAVAALGTLGIAFSAVSSGMAALTTIAPGLANTLASIITGVAAFGSGITSIPTLVSSLGYTIGYLVGSLVSLAGAFVSLVNPLSVAVAAIAAIGVAMLGWDKSIQLVKDSFTILADFISDVWNEITEAISTAIDGIKEEFLSLAEDTGLMSFVNAVEDVWNKASGFLNTFADNTHEKAENIRAENDKIALSEKNVQQSIEDAHNGVIKSGSTVDSATGQTWASMVQAAENGAGDYADANQDIIDSNGKVISSIGDVREEAAKPIKLNIEQTDISQLTTSGKGGVSVEDISKGVELSSGGKLKFNDKGELVVKVEGAPEKRVYDMGSTTLETTTGGKIYTSGGVRKDASGQPAKPISLAESAARTEQEESNETKWMRAHKGTYIDLKEQSGSATTRALLPQEQETLKNWKGKPITETSTDSKIASNKLSPEDQALMYENEERKGIPHTSPDSGHQVIRTKSNPKIDKIQGRTPVEATEPPASIKKKDVSLYDSIFGHGDNENIENYKPAAKFDLSSLTSFYDEAKSIWDKIKELTTPKDLEGNTPLAVGFSIPSLSDITSKIEPIKEAFKSLDGLTFEGLKSQFDGITSKTIDSVSNIPIVKSTLETLDGISYDGLKTSIQGYADKFTESVSNIPGVQSVLEGLNGISYDGLKTSIQGYVDKFTESVSNIPGVQSVLETLNGISYDSLKTSIQGYVDKFTESVSNIPGVQSALEALNSISYDGLKTTIQGYVDKFTESVSNIPGVQSALEGLNNISYEGLKTTIQGYADKFTETVNNMPAVQTGLEIINSISYETFKTTIQGYMDKFTETVNNMPTVKTGLEVLNSISYETLKTTIGGVWTKFKDTITQSDLVKAAINTWNDISFGGLTSTLSTLKTDIGGVVSAAQNMYNDVISYVNKARSAITGASSGTTTNTTNNTTNVKIATVNNNGTSISQNAMKLVTYGGV